MNKNSVLIWIDDERKTPYQEGYFDVRITSRDFKATISAIRFFHLWNFELYLDFDHDLGEQKTGYDVAKYLVENDIPAKYRIHSQNPVGKANIEQLLDHYSYERF